MSTPWKRHLDKFGAGGSVFTALCCLGAPAVLSALSAVGLAFLIRDAILVPLLVVFLAITLFGLYDGVRRHGNRVAIALGSAAAVLLFSSIWMGSGIAAGIGITGLVASSLLNIWFASRPRPAGVRT